MHQLKDKENQDNLFNKDLIVKREKVTILDLNEKEDIKTLESIRKSFANDRDLPRILSHENLLISELTVLQNLKFYSDVSHLERGIENLKKIFFKYLNHKRSDMEESDWQAFGLMLFLNSQSEFLFISSSLGPALNSNFKEELLLQIDSTHKTIFFNAFPPAIDVYRVISECFIINENNTLGEKIRYDEARLKVIEFNQRRDER